MPFGLTNAGAVYSRLIEQALDHLPRDYRSTYLDDILAHSKSNWDHFQHLKSIVEAHAKAGIKIQPCKTTLFAKEVQYLGHKISEDGVEMLPGYVDKVRDWPTPTNCKEKSTFLGFTGYYRSFIP